MSNVYEKLQSARVKLQSKNLKKSGKNKFSGFTYYELADFIPTVNIIFEELKLCSNFSIADNTAKLEIINTEKPEEIILFTMPTAELELKGCTAIQALGGVNTYCRRYLYLNALEIVESDMLDGKAGDIQEKKKPVPPKKSEVNNDDMAIYDKVAQCQTVEELNKLWQAEHKNVSDETIFKNLCASHKAVIQEGENK